MDWLRGLKRKRSQRPSVSISRPRTDVDSEPQPSQNRSIHVSRQDSNRRLGQSSTGIHVQEDVSLQSEPAEELTPWSPSFFDEPSAQPPEETQPVPDQQDESSVRNCFFVTCYIINLNT
jgi:hypothetical protein